LTNLLNISSLFKAKSDLQKKLEMGDKSVSFKVCLNDATSEPEVRRFVVDRDVSSSLSYLREKLITIFPALRKDFKLTWTDDEGDKVTISSDDELIIALSEMKGPVYKLSINILSDKDTSKDEESGSGNSEGEEHPGVCEDKQTIIKKDRELKRKAKELLKSSKPSDLGGIHKFKKM